MLFLYIGEALIDMNWQLIGTVLCLFISQYALPELPYCNTFTKRYDGVLVFRLPKQSTIHHAKSTVSQYPLAFTGMNDYDVTVKIYIWG